MKKCPICGTSYEGTVCPRNCAIPDEKSLPTFENIRNRANALKGETEQGKSVKAGDLLEIILDQQKHMIVSAEKENTWRVIEKNIQQLMEDSVKNVAKFQQKKELSASEMGGRIFKNLFRLSEKDPSEARAMSAFEMAEMGAKAIKEGNENWPVKSDVVSYYGGLTQKDIDRMEGKALVGTPLYGDSGTGAYVVPTAYASEVDRVSLQSSQMMGLVTRIPMTTRTFRRNRLATHVSLAWPTTEATAKSETNPTFGTYNLTCQTCAAWTTIVDELEEDTTVPLMQFFMELLMEKWGYEFDYQALVSAAAPWTGWLANTSVNAATMATGKTTYSAVTGDDLVSLIDAISIGAGENALAGARFIMHRTVFNWLTRLKATGSGQPIFQQLTESAPTTILGFPYSINDRMPSTATAAQAGTAFIAFGNPKYWAYGDRIGREFKIYRDTIQNVTQDQIFLRFRTRAGFTAMVPTAVASLFTAAA